MFVTWIVAASDVTVVIVVANEKVFSVLGLPRSLGVDGRHEAALQFEIDRLK